MRGAGDDGRAGRGAGSGSARRVVGLAVGCLAVVGATAVVFLTDDPQLLRIAVVAVAWACLLAAFASARPAPDGSGPGAAREADLRAAHGPELAAARDGERERSERLRRDAEDAMRRELDALRAEVAGLREGLSGLDGLAREVAAIGALHGDLRGELADLAGLRADVGRLRTELTDRSTAGQLSGEMRVERVVVHAQSVRTGPGREPLEPATAAWSAGVARELSGNWPAGPAQPAGVVADAARPEPAPELRPAPEPVPVARPLPAVPAHPPVPAADRAPLGRRRSDPPAGLRLPAAYGQPTVQRPAVHATAAGHAGVPAAPVPAAVGAPDEEAGSARLAQILAESGVTPGGRRRRYRDQADGG
ncbi:hypothetical protein SAMN05660359_01640 [Geodermatophilus obscurus]|uniref:DUF6779 domain-containing protein n=1 Tax=Geodermatophilus obscurus TaxID=1861 RepID=A0A1I5EP47_9ACTN|nr:DUF6779 domain-containing protein [Geodermatophilus obscurus]SFO13278.1 hypothetical protein SAMN05660359_01640 [Geodermatophilus obscurus]